MKTKAKKVKTKAGEDVAVSKENDKDRETTIKHIETHQEGIKMTAEKVDKIIETNRIQLIKDKEKLEKHKRKQAKRND